MSFTFFGLIHAANKGATLESTLAIALEAGILLAASYILTRSLWLPIGLHFGWNFTEGGIFGAAAGSTLGKHTDGERLLILFGMLMVAVAASMAMKKEGGGKAHVRLERGNAPWIVAIGFVVGALSGFFGIGGGFLVVPGLVAATSMALITAIGSSLVSVTAFGLTTAANYALSGLIDWRLVLLFVGGGIAGGLVGGQLATALAARKRALSTVFAVVIAGIGVYVIARGIMNLMG